MPGMRRSFGSIFLPDGLPRAAREREVCLPLSLRSVGCSASYRFFLLIKVVYGDSVNYCLHSMIGLMPSRFEREILRCIGYKGARIVRVCKLCSRNTKA